MCDIFPNPVSDEARRDLRAYLKLLNDLSDRSVETAVMKQHVPGEAYRMMADKLHLGLYVLYQLHDWLLVHQAELVEGILEPFYCPRCHLRIHPPQPLDN